MSDEERVQYMSDAAAFFVVVVLFFGIISWFIMFMAIAVHMVRGGCS